MTHTLNNGREQKLPVRKNRYSRLSEKDHKVAIKSIFIEPKETLIKAVKKEW